MSNERHEIQEKLEKNVKKTLRRLIHEIKEDNEVIESINALLRKGQRIIKRVLDNTDYQKSLLAQYFTTTNEIKAKEMQLRDLEDALRGGAIFFISAPLFQIFLLLLIIASQIVQIREELKSLRSNVNFLNKALKATI